MKTHLFIYSLVALAIGTACSHKTNEFTGADGEVKLITLAPGHFHAALVQKISYPQVAKDVYVYAPAGDDLQEHLKKIEAYNTRAEDPTTWNEIIYTGDDYLSKMIAEKRGNVMVTAGNNGKKTAYIKQALEAGINVLSDKPMAINEQSFEMLKECFDIAKKNNVMLYDIMTERFEINTILQKELSLLPAIYGKQLMGTAQDPAIVKESVHHFFKYVSGSPLKRPAWFFDVEQEGDGIVDVTTHLVDLVQWSVFPDEIIDYTKDYELLDANRWTTAMTVPQFKQITGFDSFPDYLKKDVVNDTLYVYSNGDMIYRLRGVHSKVSVIWDYTYPEGGGDTHFSVMKGSKADFVIRQGAEQGYKPELFIEAVGGTDIAAYEKELTASISSITKRYPGVSLVKKDDNTWYVQIPDSYRIGHEAHFGKVTENFLKYLVDGELPAWEVPNMIAKYYLTAQALKVAKAK